MTSVCISQKLENFTSYGSWNAAFATLVAGRMSSEARQAVAPSHGLRRSTSVGRHGTIPSATPTARVPASYAGPQESTEFRDVEVGCAGASPPPNGLRELADKFHHNA
jgi:hypothetical protein